MKNLENLKNAAKTNNYGMDHYAVVMHLNTLSEDHRKSVVRRMEDLIETGRRIGTKVTFAVIDGKLAIHFEDLEFFSSKLALNYLNHLAMVRLPINTMYLVG